SNRVGVSTYGVNAGFPAFYDSLTECIAYIALNGESVFTFYGDIKNPFYNNRCKTYKAIVEPGQCYNTADENHPDRKKYIY
ncbi:hypothetical protein PIROE2DRAFT_17873, partial [Piromyces sp. E2]